MTKSLNSGSQDTAPQAVDFEVVENVKIVIRAELDRRTISFPELMHMEPGTVLALRRPTGENVDVFAGNVQIGNAEILVIDSSLAVRIADLRQKAPARDGEPQELAKANST